MPTRLLGALCCAGAAALAATPSASAQDAGPAHGDFGTRTRTERGVVERTIVDIEPEDGVAIEAVHVDNRLGNVRVEGHDGTGVTVRAVKRAIDDDTLDRLKVSLVPDPNGPLRVRTSLAAGPEARPIAAGTIAIDLVLRVPRNARAEVAVWRGDIAVKGVDRGAELSVNAGDIEVEHVSGAVSTHALRGDQRFVEVLGDVFAQGVDGSLTMDVVRGEQLDARTHDGRISARRVRAARLTLISTTGDVELAGAVRPGGSYRVASLRGNVRVDIERGTPFRLEARAAGALVVPRLGRVRRAPGSAVGHYGGGRRPAGLVVISRHGDVRVGLVDPSE